MKKVVIPTILAATILVAGMFAMMPVQKASTVHSALGGGQTQVLTAAGVTPGTAATDTATWTVGQPFCVMEVSFTPTVDAGGDLNVGVLTAATNFEAAGNTALADPGLIAVGTPNAIMPAGGMICGSTTLAIVTVATAGAAATDAVTLNVVIQAQSIAAAPAAVLS